jgi:hypothetical protein
MQMELWFDVVAFAEIPEVDQIESIMEGVSSLRA